ncbi:hypothetical protein FSARC_14585 [Fusarium sarcochroum]|uniref:Methyltransferase n=1 Tax=Fusarium sarcochroum TaxID=1208366 RepID=A0A8H4SSK6_9HYPO|nr:hypothetical protein FSARC_14585 [Fusarium sarcochroum]
MASDEDTKYLLGDNAREIERLQKQHIWIQKSHDNKIVFAPIQVTKDGLRVLDVGCADGTLLRDLQKQVSPSAKLVGVDIMESFLPPSNENIIYQFYDLCEPPEQGLSEAFDLTHVRLVIGGVAKVGIQKAVEHLAATVAPEGWLQVQELDFDPNDRQIAGPAWRDVNSVLAGMFEAFGLGGNYTSKIFKAFEDAGLLNVKVETIYWPMGKLLGGDEAGKESWQITIPSIIQAAKMLNADIPDSTYENLTERFIKEVDGQGVVFRTFVFIGQKPASE